MSLTTTGASLLLLVLEDAHLLFLALLFDLAGNLRTVNIRCSYSGCRIAYQNDLVKDNGIARFAVSFSTKMAWSFSTLTCFPPVSITAYITYTS